MQWNGDKQTVPLIADQRRHVARHGASDRDLSTIFEADCEVSRNLSIGHRGAGARDPRGPCEANAARGLLGRLERQPAGHATRMAKELDAFPAIGTKAVHVIDDRAAARAARR